MEILTKRQSTDGYKNGRFGNHLRQWDTLREVGRSGVNDIMIRYRGLGSFGPAHCTNQEKLIADYIFVACFYNLTTTCERDLYFSERAPDDRLTFQGEICELPSVGGYALHYSTRKQPQREALRNFGSHKHGPGALLLCKQFMDGDSYEDLRTLLDLYPLHVVEFSCFNVRLGNLRRNTIFWEVRKF